LKEAPIKGTSQGPLVGPLVRASLKEAPYSLQGPLAGPSAGAPCSGQVLRAAVWRVRKARLPPQKRVCEPEVRPLLCPAGVASNPERGKKGRQVVGERELPEIPRRGISGWFQPAGNKRNMPPNRISFGGLLKEAPKRNTYNNPLFL
jgi:hypothetical protein